jgi:hypothetical protein
MVGCSVCGDIPDSVGLISGDGSLYCMRISCKLFTHSFIFPLIRIFTDLSWGFSSLLQLHSLLDHIPVGHAYHLVSL